LAVVAGMKTLNDYTEPTEVERNFFFYEYKIRESQKLLRTVKIQE